MPATVRLVDGPGDLRDRVVEVLGWTTDRDETALICRLADGSAGTLPARWTDLPWRVEQPPALGELGSPAGWRLLLVRAGGLRARSRGAQQPPWKTEAVMSGQLALVIESEAVVAAAVWEALPAERRLEVTLRLARLLARLVEAERDE